MVRESEECAVAIDGSRFTLPTLMIDDLYSVQAGAASFNIHPMRDHTWSDQAIHLPQLKLVATGDLVDAMPCTGHSTRASGLYACEHKAL